MENTCEHPIVFLKDIKYEEIRTILDYMYKGEVNVAQEELPGRFHNIYKCNFIYKLGDPTILILFALEMFKRLKFNCE
jgi:hypothetical protein